MVFWFSSQIIPGMQLFKRLPVLLEPFLRGRDVDAELHQSLTVARDFKVIARSCDFGQPGEQHVQAATIGQGADGEIMFDGIDNQQHTAVYALCIVRSNRVLKWARLCLAFGAGLEWWLGWLCAVCMGVLHRAFGVRFTMFLE